MSRRVERADDRSGDRTAPARDEPFVRLDVAVFESITDTSGLAQCGQRPRIERWLDCWSGP
ncbi:hypothetical protein ACFQL1_15415 [Halomicroarcula sp. GCM10025709]|uniref:hypothetical protein n=1 Tax=Haloarcula TaxID=2237 RepID=UPI0024C37B13|nr:hypothetical protein [Halomicroarcula sp. YJ-61-S]